MKGRVQSAVLGYSVFDALSTMMPLILDSCSLLLYHFCISDLGNALLIPGGSLDVAMEKGMFWHIHPLPALFLSFFSKHLLCVALYNQCSSKRVCLADSRLKMSYPSQVDAFISLWSVILINGVKSLSFLRKIKQIRRKEMGLITSDTLAV